MKKYLLILPALFLLAFSANDKVWTEIKGWYKYTKLATASADSTGTPQGGAVYRIASTGQLVVGPAGSGGGSTDLSYSQNATNNTVNSSTGTDVTLLIGTSALAGLIDSGRIKSIDSMRYKTSGGTGGGYRTILRDATAFNGDTLNIASGTYTPTVADGTNATSLGSSTFSYSRNGDWINVSGVVTLTVTAANTLTSVSVTVPVTAQLGTAVAAIGSGTDDANYVSVYVGGYSGSLTKVLVQTKPTSTSTHTWYIIFRYRVK